MFHNEFLLTFERLSMFYLIIHVQPTQDSRRGYNPQNPQPITPPKLKLSLWQCKSELEVIILSFNIRKSFYVFPTEQQ